MYNNAVSIAMKICLRLYLLAFLSAALPVAALAQSRVAPGQVVQQVRDYRLKNEGRIVQELVEFLAIPNVASDTVNIQKNAAHLVEMLKARGIESKLTEEASLEQVFLHLTGTDMRDTQ